MALLVMLFGGCEFRGHRFDRAPAHRRRGSRCRVVVRRGPIRDSGITPITVARINAAAAPSHTGQLRRGCRPCRAGGRAAPARGDRGLQPSTTSRPSARRRSSMKAAARTLRRSSTSARQFGQPSRCRSTLRCSAPSRRPSTRSTRASLRSSQFISDRRHLSALRSVRQIRTNPHPRLVHLRFRRPFRDAEHRRPLPGARSPPRRAAGTPPGRPAAAIRWRAPDRSGSPRRRTGTGDATGVASGSSSESVCWPIRVWRLRSTSRQ